MSVVSIMEKFRQGGYGAEPIPVIPLTDRRKEVLELICSDLSTKEIAVRLNKSKKTIEKHRQYLAKISGTHTPIGLFRWALANGYVQPPPLADK